MLKFCNSLVRYERFKSREVTIGEVPLGGTNPIRVQSMTTTDTLDTKATVAQSIRMIEAGCEYVRITAPSIKEAENLANIKREIRAAGYQTPLIADIHFTPNAAEIAARIVEKVRVNPGNYADKKKFQVLEYSDAEYAEELDRIRQKFYPLVSICKENGTAMRIGTNHGSLSDRIMSRYGDTPMGMVESALEFVRFCEEMNYYDLVISMKASNPQVMVQAYRLLVQQMMEHGQNYPLHLGVTEAGDGEDGRIKSAVGIGALLEDGLGDTVRVSLTEEPEAEIPVAKKLISRYENRTNHDSISPVNQEFYHPFEYQKTECREVMQIGGDHSPIVIADCTDFQEINYSVLQEMGYTYQVELDKYSISDAAADFAFLGNKTIDHIELPGNLKLIYKLSTWKSLPDSKKRRGFPLLSVQESSEINELHSPLYFVEINAADINSIPKDWEYKDKPIVFVLTTSNKAAMAQFRQAMLYLQSINLNIPVVFYRELNTSDEEQLSIDCSADVGPLFLDGFGQGIWLHAPKVPLATAISIQFGILQATRSRITKTEYISCPSCGRTLFDLQETTAMIRAKTSHLKGLKIGIMGCIVNGPGEMADADYGYVGSGVGKVTLYRGQEVVKRQIDSESALDELIQIIKEDGNWVEESAQQEA